jgi:23S rRNA-/tRNA-specific pseudouridylate synthase
VIIAKEKKILEKLLELLQHDGIIKVYHAIVMGTLEKPRNTIKYRLLRVEDAKNEAKVRVDPAGQEAITHYRVLKENIRDKYSLLECQIETGRTHQIRVHLASIDHPILGDKSYGNK